MKSFLCDDFLLETDTAKKLYHRYAEKMPIFDYHCHLSAKEIAEDKRYKNLTEVWLAGDHYKWRAMRINGVMEQYLTGNKSDREKFQKWAETIPFTIGNPLYHWVHLELSRYFRINETLNDKNADLIWRKCNDMLKQKEFTARGLIKRSNVTALCTTDNPIDSLEYHKIIKEDNTFDVKVMPTFRPDEAVSIENEEFISWIEKLEKVCGMNINNYSEFLNALAQRIDYFDEVGCKLSDHGLDEHFFMEAAEEEIVNIFNRRLNNESLSECDIRKYKTGVLMFLGKEYKKRNWAMQLHIGALRNNNTKMYNRIGRDKGFDSIADFSYAEELSRFLNSLDSIESLPKTILYCLNPRDNYLIGTMIGNFQGDGIPGKIQFGSAWWFNDNKDGMEQQMRALSNLGLLSRFVGMVTDSRSFLSYTRHEYFRRILCNLIGKWVENGEYPDDFEILDKIIKGVCFKNVQEYLGIN